MNNISAPHRRLIAASVISILLAGGGSEAVAAVCADPQLGLRGCDDLDMDCPVSWNDAFPPPSWDPRYRADYTSFAEAVIYLEELDDPAIYPEDLIEFSTINLPSVGYIDASGAAYSMSFPLVKLSMNASWGRTRASPTRSSPAGLTRGSG